MNITDIDWKKRNAEKWKQQNLSNTPCRWKSIQLSGIYE